MFDQSPFVGPGAGSLVSHSLEILVMLLGAFLLGYWLSRILSARDRARLARLEAQVAALLLASVNVAPVAAAAKAPNDRAVGAAQPATRQRAEQDLERESPLEAQAEPRPDARLDIAAGAQAGAPHHTHPAAETKDDLKRIKGIGPNVEAALNAAGITTFAALARAGEQDLRRMLIGHDPRFRIHDPASWPAQAAMARDGDWQTLGAWRKAARTQKK